MCSQKQRNKNYLLLSVIFLLLGAVWAVVIFGFSSQNAEESASLSEEVTEVIIETFEVETEPSIIEHFVRKTAHFCEYAVFGGLILACFAFFFKFRESSPYKGYIFSSLIALLYASSDEYHQGFVSGRSPQLTDVFIDTSGAVLAGGGICLIMLLVSHIKKKNTQD